MLVPDANWNLRLISVKGLEFQLALGQRADFTVEFILFTRQNPTIGQEIRSGDAEALHKSHFNPRNPTRFVCHGWRGNRNAQENGWIRDKYLNLGDYNVFVVDWRGGADTINYIAASQNTKEAGKQLATFVDFLNIEASMNFNTLYLIVHSLGSHVVGYAGKNLKRGRINTIFGLDPALPLFSADKTDKRLAPGDALYVESIQTNGGVLGFDKPVGDASFYPNWGKDQPGCSGNDLTGGCSHTRSTQYFAESLDRTDLFVGEQCKNYAAIENKTCDPTGRTAKMGGEPSNQGHGVIGEFYLPTKSSAPFAMGTSWMNL